MRGRHRKEGPENVNEPGTLGQQLVDVIGRFGITGPIVGMESDGSNIKVEVIVTDPYLGPLLDAHEDDKLATMTWSGRLQSGASKVEPRVNPRKQGKRA